MKEYYVYEYSDPITNEIFYVGKGQGNRCYDHIAEAKKEGNKGNLLKKSKIRKILKHGLEPVVTIVYKTLNEQDAYDEEGRRVKLYGRRDLGTGPLTNLNDGGTGSSAMSQETKDKIQASRGEFRHTEETKQKIREANAGTEHSEETKLKISEALTGREVSEESKQNMSISAKNRCTDEWRKEASERMKAYVHAHGSPGKVFEKGNIPWNKGKEHMQGEDNPMFGKNHSEDTKMKMSNAVKGRKRVYREDGSYYMIKPEVV